MVPHNPTEIIQRPEAPYDLTGEQAAQAGSRRAETARIYRFHV
jgi:hypothetical protein